MINNNGDVAKTNYKTAKLKEKFMEIIFLIAAISGILAVILITLFLFVNGIPAIAEIGFFDFLLGTNWAPTDIPASYGIFPMILGSIYITAGALLIGVPIGILTSIFMSHVCPHKLYKLLKPATQLLAGIPSVLYGFFGIVVVVPIVSTLFGGSGNSILSASIILGIMILPTIIGISESAIRAVPSTYYEGSRALGASHYKAVFSAVVPAAKSGIMAAVVLGVGRAIGETMAVVMIAGNQPIIPSSLFRGARTLTANIAIEMGYASELHRGALIATGVVLFVFILLINIIFSILKRRSKR